MAGVGDMAGMAAEAGTVAAATDTGEDTDIALGTAADIEAEVLRTPTVAAGTAAAADTVVDTYRQAEDSTAAALAAAVDSTAAAEEGSMVAAVVVTGKTGNPGWNSSPVASAAGLFHLRRKSSGYDALFWVSPTSRLAISSAACG